MRTLFGHGTPRQAADAVLVAVVVALRVALKKFLGFGEPFFGTFIPPATAHRRAADLAG